MSSGDTARADCSWKLSSTPFDSITLRRGVCGGTLSVRPFVAAGARQSALPRPEILRVESVLPALIDLTAAASLPAPSMRCPLRSDRARALRPGRASSPRHHRPPAVVTGAHCITFRLNYQGADLTTDTKFARTTCRSAAYTAPRHAILDYPPRSVAAVAPCTCHAPTSPMRHYPIRKGSRNHVFLAGRGREGVAA